VANVARGAEPRNPITGFADRWARAASGHVATELTRVMKSRRLIRSPRLYTKDRTNTQR
jgi:hypothetical protein